MTDDLVAFLRARLDEDEHVGRMADIGRGSGTGPWELWTITNPARGEVRATPARVLAEVEAKRRIIAMHHPTQSDWPLLRVIALPYAAHPDYREEWAP